MSFQSAAARVAGALLVFLGAAAAAATSPQQAAVADIIGSKARAGGALAAFQMMSDFGSIVGSFLVGEIAQRWSFELSFVVSGALLLLAAVGWMLAPETRATPLTRPTPARALGPEAGGELP